MAEPFTTAAAAAIKESEAADYGQFDFQADALIEANPGVHHGEPYCDWNQMVHLRKCWFAERTDDGTGWIVWTSVGPHVLTNSDGSVFVAPTLSAAIAVTFNSQQSWVENTNHVLSQEGKAIDERGEIVDAPTGTELVEVVAHPHEH